MSLYNTLKCLDNLVWLTTWTSSLLFLCCWFSDHLGRDSCNINFIKPGMHPSIPPLHWGEGWIDDDEKRRVAVEGKEVGGFVMAQTALLNSYWKASKKDERWRSWNEAERRDWWLKERVVKQLGTHDLTNKRDKVDEVGNVHDMTHRTRLRVIQHPRSEHQAAFTPSTKREPSFSLHNVSSKFYIQGIDNGRKWRL